MAGRRVIDRDVMHIARLQVENFRSIRNADVPLSPFLCAIGANNSGKSSLLMAMSLFSSGRPLSPSDHYDQDHDVVITVQYTGVTDRDLQRLVPEHRERIAELVEDGSLTLIRRYPVEGKSLLRCHRRVPGDQRFWPESIAELLSAKKGLELRAAVVETFPELDVVLPHSKTLSQKACKEEIQKLLGSLDRDTFVAREESLPTGIDNSVLSILPEPVYIPAVKDATDEVKTKEASSFGRILKILLELVEGTEQLQNIQASFEQLHGMLNRTKSEDGQIVDSRIAEVRQIEQLVSGFVQEQFRNVAVEIEIPPPDMKTVFNSAKIFLDDGVRGEIDTKGDGLKRAVTFSLLRTYVELRHRQRTGELTAEERTGRYLFLFEEPELYLHPTAQRILYDALEQIAQGQQVCICTHSPYFFSATGTGTFLRLSKPAPSENGGAPPVTSILPVDLVSDLPKKDAFQIICYENNSAAFFCHRVVLVEGDCDIIYLKHAARVLNDQWNFDRQNLAIVKVGGKGSFARYRAFFEGFGVEVRIISDLDSIVDQYAKLGAPQECDALRSALLNEVDAVIAARNAGTTIAPDQIRSVTSRRSFVERYQRCRELAARMHAGQSVSSDELSDFGELFLDEQDFPRRNTIANDGTVAASKLLLLRSLRTNGINVLSRGSVEAYYPAGVTGDDKPTRALKACELVQARDAILSSCPRIDDGNNTERPELEIIFENVFANLM